MAKTRLAIIGAGGHAKAGHYRDPGLRHCPEEIELCAACDLDRDKLAAVADEFGVPAVYTDFREMIAEAKPDGIVIVLPPTLVAEMARACLELGQHVIVEKPPGCNLTEAQSILDTAVACERKVAVSVDRRFFPVTQLLKRKLVPSKINHLNMSYNKAFFSWGAPTNLFTADAIHLIDLFLYLGGPVDEVHAYASRRGEGLLRSFSGVLKLAAGGVGTFNCHNSMPPGRHGRRQLFDVTSDGLSAYLDLGPTMGGSAYGGNGTIIDGTDELPVEEYFAEIAGEPHPAAGSEMLDFARWIRGEKAPIAPLEEVIETVRLTEAVAAGYCGKLSEFEPVFDRTNAP
ncbi:MAG: Gfo/Idh/MocA family oxidoreductase [Lentisphaerae bacterium]|jgi:predicted dehydrogenase|nr:Gfo/Idh/MocA family oxidoreductase [Lentisphaerota bacterium]MBT4814078.1 Gfo/Idh/MocA family oxidoreductase [Lentisphaerota bacterium]MBT5608997.1 Gfo/Idh/MocA family oxidoreductase [Lentisphaerota bacterium]MBT7054674.1 Gfo/Idh/MocA family oxidoreductase [Lentisphaerota bacterium]MBT7846654.1 Gfo/Idh/MocA family oxidoreductase [Lentisphaerota bacterium]